MIAVASFGDDPEQIQVILPPGDPETVLADVATKPDFQLFGMALSYAYPEKELAKLQAQPANTLVEIASPYCFHVPDRATFGMKDERGAVHLAFRKVWTDRTAGSSSADYRSPTRVLYHNKTTLQTPNFPTQPDLGPEPVCKGINIEADKDRSGVYRYSVVRIFFDTAYTVEMLTAKAAAESARSESIARAIAVLNRFIDVYRVVTNSAHIQRVPNVHVRDIYFRELNLGFHAASFGHGIRTAIMNRSETELKAISRIITAGEEIAPWDLLFLDAQSSLGSNSFTLAVVNAFQALELRLEDFLEKKMALQGLSTAQIEEQLSRNWRTKDRLRVLVPDLAGRKLITDDQALWNRFCWAYDDIRNKLIHAARDLDDTRTETAITACRDVSRWLDSIA
jgi:hypothetical protein